MPILRLMAGVAGSGKSTYLRHNPRPGEIVLSPDTVLVEKYDYQWSPARAAEAWATEYQRFGKLILEGRDLAFDAMFLSGIERSALLHIAKGAGYEIWGCVFMVPLDVCLQRNRDRDREPVPEDKIRQMHNRFRAPTLDEGFDRIITIED